MHLSPVETKNPNPRYILKESAERSYTMEGLETLVYNGAINLETAIALEGENHFRALSQWSFAGRLFPQKKVWGINKQTAVVPVRQQIVVASDSNKLGTHITSLEDLQLILKRDQHDPKALAILNELKARMHQNGTSIQQTLDAYFAENTSLNRRLTSKALYKYVGDATRGNKAAMLVCATACNGFFGYMALTGDTLDRQCALGGSAFMTAIFVSAYAFGIDKWLNMNPGKAAFTLLVLIYTTVVCSITFMHYQLGLISPSLSFVQAVWFVITGN